MASGPSGGARVLAAHSRAFSLEVASLAATYKFSEAPGALRARFFTRLGRFAAQTCSPERPRDAPGLEIRAQNNSCCEVFPFDEHSMRKPFDIKKTL